MLKWRVGDVTISKIVEFEQDSIDATMLLPDAAPAAVQRIGWLRPHFANDTGLILMSFHALVIDTPTRKILVDTCVGADKERGIPMLDRLKWPFLEHLTQAGYSREAIDTVVCTHLHIDHVGWNTMLVNGRWVPTFPKARLLLEAAEFQHWRTQESDAVHRQVFADSVAPVWDAGLVELVASNHQICEEVRLIPTPGHTPGHVSVQITSRGEEAIITGDMIHHPCQFAHPDWATSIDFDAAQSTRSRHQLFAEVTDKPVLVIGTHFVSPTAGHVVRDGDAYRFVV